MQNQQKLFSMAFVVLAIAIFGTGCSITSGVIGHEILTEVQLNQANFDVIKSVTGQAQADYFLGIGPSEQDLLGQAKRAMILQAQLKGSQALINVTTDIQHTGFLIWRQRKAYVSAEIVQFK